MYSFCWYTSSGSFDRCVRTVSYSFVKGKVSSLKVIMDSDYLEIELFGELNATTRVYRMSCARDVAFSVVSAEQHVTLL